MKKIFSIALLLISTVILSCNSGDETTKETTNSTDATAAAGGQENVKDDVSEKDVVKVAMSSPDHTTLVAALKHAGLVSSLSNAGPFTVFAPTNEAFKKLPAGTVEDLMKDANKEKLVDVLQYHVFVSALQPDYFKDGQTLNMVNGDDLKVSVSNGNVTLNDKAHIIKSIPASNGIIYVIDEVLLPSPK
ncbi:MAG TPA: fasciclin domain-containing protein [Hanamia sp.]|nr:fasciclin domain-containing protein [Hanamia sp.]